LKLLYTQNTYKNRPRTVNDCFVLLATYPHRVNKLKWHTTREERQQSVTSLMLTYRCLDLNTAIHSCWLMTANHNECIKLQPN